MKHQKLLLHIFLDFVILKGLFIGFEIFQRILDDKIKNVLLIKIHRLKISKVGN